MNEIQSVHWSPARWAPSRLSAPPKQEWSGSVLGVPLEAVGGAGAGFVGGLIVDKPIGNLLHVSPPMATGILAGLSAAAAFVLRKRIPLYTGYFLYGLGTGLAGAAAFRLIQIMFEPPAKAPATP